LVEEFFPGYIKVEQGDEVVAKSEIREMKNMISDVTKRIDAIEESQNKK